MPTEAKTRQRLSLSYCKIVLAIETIHLPLMDKLGGCVAFARIAAVVYF